MNRREALKTTAALLGGALVACTREPRTQARGVLDAGDQALAEQIADTLLPTTADSPGAAAAHVGPTINLLLTDCYDPEDQHRVARGLQAFRAMCRNRHGRDFNRLAPHEREGLLRTLDLQAQQTGDGHWFGLFRDVAQRAYFTSEVGATQALRYLPVPGRWEGCVPLRPGQPAWA